MQDITDKRTFRITAVILMMAMLLPSAVKFTHTFNHHQHEICDGEYQAHLHKSDINCSFYKFKLTSSFILIFHNYDILQKVDNHTTVYTTYDYFSEHGQLTFYLRGPPTLV